MSRQRIATQWEQRLDAELSALTGEGSEAQAGVTVSAGVQDADPPRPLRADGDDAGRTLTVARLREELGSDLRMGVELSDHIFDENDVLLLAAGSRLTERFLEILRERGITRVRLRSSQTKVTPVRDAPVPAAPTPPPFVEVEGGTPRSRELYVRHAEELRKTVSLHPVRTWRRPRLSLDDLKSEACRGLEQHVATSEVVVDLCSALDRGGDIPVAELRRSIRQFVDMASVDFDLLPTIVAMQKSKDEYLYDHCVNVSLLSMAMASHLGLDHEAVTAIGLGGLLHDIGMLRVPLSIRLGTAALGDREWQEIHRHPLHTLDMLADLRRLPEAVPFVAHQLHERIDGSGYPNGRSGRQLHRYAEIVAIADVYAAMTHPRPHRPAVIPYEAVKTVLVQGGEGKFDRFLVRALLDTISVFPTGSQVRLSTGKSARVVRANPGRHTRPVVEELAADGSPTGQIIDLSAEGMPAVARAG